MPAISKKEVEKKRKESIPEVVFEVFNEMLEKQGPGIIYQKDVREILRGRMTKEDFDQIYTRGWFDIEEHYRKAGWKVTYDKPGYNEHYDANWEFQ